MAKRPQRQRKADRLLSPGSTPEEQRCDFALAPFDRLARQMEEKWGIERLPELVSPEMAEKYGKAISGLNAAIDKSDPEEVMKWAAVCIRGLKALDAQAEKDGAPKADPTVWEYDLDGFKFGIMADDKSWMAVKDARPELMLFTMREVAIALQAYQFDGVAEVKKHFPAATIEKIKPKKPSPDYERGGDPITFGGKA